MRFKKVSDTFQIVIEMTNVEFDEIILSADTEEKRLQVVQKYLFHGTPFVFAGRDNDYFEFRNRIAKNFNVGFHEVFIIGSAKLGFSYHKKTTFSLNSDIDVVIVNTQLFEYFYREVCGYQYKLDRLKETVDMKEMNMYHTFLKYLVKGWMRPDKLPISFQVKELKLQWFDFFQSVSNGKTEVGNYKVAAGLFKNYEYLEKYYVNSIENVFNSMK